jgi:uncharacterized protein (TIGR03435 family)
VRPRSALWVVLAAAVNVAAQDALPAFEVASIKPRAGEPGGNSSSSPDRFNDSDATLAALIRYAFDVEDFQVIGGPDWVRSRRFDVSAKAPGERSENEIRLMLRRLLAERFKLATHDETRRLPMYALVKSREDGRLGDGLRPSNVDCLSILWRGGGVPPRAAGEPLPTCLWRVGITPTVATMLVDGAPIPQFAKLLQRLVNRVVVDRTGLSGFFDIRLEFSAEQLPMRIPLPPDAAAPPSRDGLSLFTALQEQLGLELDAQDGPVPVIVIDRAELPTPD